jgi:isocitrate/isopropylmalate dehydrogenase
MSEAIHRSNLFQPLLTIVHKSNVLSVTDGLFREAVRAVPNLEDVNGKYDGVRLEEQLVDSMVYRYARPVSRCLHEWSHSSV